jgi:hypothetical protein
MSPAGSAPVGEARQRLSCLCVFRQDGGNEPRLMKRYIREPEQVDQPLAFSERLVGRIVIVCLLYFTQQFP